MATMKSYRQLSPILMEIIDRLLNNQTLCKLLYYADKNPLSHADITSTKVLLNDYILFMPRVGTQEATKNKIVLVYPNGFKDPTNNDILELPIDIYVFVPFTSWIIEGNDLRMFLLMSEIEETLDAKTVGGVGKLASNGFEMFVNTDEISSYRMDFKINVFS